ncbi:hypothetical protein [Demequina litorisediminis]|uniref:hypothetical protein n=1 Tax=Demequina litorisediminis TaxID=1849022 RepID=UPI0024E0645B|nr:hypothetical protein [Demequina litorisediminis]
MGTSSVADRPWQTYLAVLVAGYGAMVIVKTAPFPFPRRDTWVVLATVAVSSALVFGAVTDTGTLGRATWHLGSNTWLLFFLALRGRPLAAWVGMAIMVGESAVWGVLTGRGALSAVMMSNSHIGILIVATLFARQAQRHCGPHRRATGARRGIGRGDGGGRCGPGDPAHPGRGTGDAGGAAAGAHSQGRPLRRRRAGRVCAGRGAPARRCARPFPRPTRGGRGGRGRPHAWRAGDHPR